MYKTYVVRNFLTGEYHDYFSEWSTDPLDVHEFETLEEAEQFISTQSGKFVIETIYNPN